MKQLKLPLEWIDCRYYNDCDAPLCPQDINLEQCLWFPREQVCRLRNAPDWVKKQRKISRIKNIDEEAYFTVTMLQKIGEITSDIRGADPESVDGEREWLSRWPRRKRKKKSDTPVDTENEGERKQPGTYRMFDDLGSL
ncbi:MAG: hypothetical protein R6U89_03360 [Dehalococcoidia bacterium]